MQSSNEIFFIITTMDGVPVTKNDGTIMQFSDTTSCRNNTKDRTFKQKERHHSRALTKDQFFRAKKEFLSHWLISLTTLGRKWDHN
jgi:hypothetical protein